LTRDNICCYKRELGICPCRVKAHISDCLELSLPSRPIAIGDRGQINKYVRPGPEERCPAEEFLDGLERSARKKFEGKFDALAKNGTDIPPNPQRYKPLIGKGKPLWEFKEHGDRIYCERLVISGNNVLITLFNGWSKDKEGRTKREDTEILKAQNLYREFRPKTGGSL
jgi:hypothetical protein